MSVPENLKYTKSHEWALISGNMAKVGISDFAQKELTDIVFVELPELDAETSAGAECAVIESVKTAVDVYSPLSGKVVKVNEALQDSPETINSDPYGEGWIFEVEMTASDEVSNLMDAAAYKQEIGE